MDFALGAFPQIALLRVGRDPCNRLLPSHCAAASDFVSPLVQRQHRRTMLDDMNGRDGRGWGVGARLSEPTGPNES
jgi:hypothetical protein